MTKNIKRLLAALLAMLLALGAALAVAESAEIEAEPVDAILEEAPELELAGPSEESEAEALPGEIVDVPEVNADPDPDCPHEDTYEDIAYYNRKNYQAIGPQKHRFDGDAVTEVWCYDCNDYIYRSDPVPGTYEDWHCFNESGVREECGYVCKHEEVGSSFEYDYDSDTLTYKNITATTHAYDCERITVLRCVYCDQELGRSSEFITRTERHYFDEDDGICTACGYHNECKHLRTNTYDSVDWDEETSAPKKKNARQHTFKAKGYVVTECLDCGTVLSTKSKSFTVTEDHYYELVEEDGTSVCLACDYVNKCKHARTETFTGVDEPDFIEIPGNDSLHNEVGYGFTYTLCTTCGELMGEHGLSRSITLEQPHDYDSHGICLECGHQASAYEFAAGNVTLRVERGKGVAFVPANGFITAVKSSSAKVATVDESGWITGVAEGKAKVTVTTSTGKKYTATVNVFDPKKPEKVALTHDGDADAKGVIQLPFKGSVTLTPDLDPITAEATYTWKTSNAKIAAVDENGVVTPTNQKEGTVTVTATTHNGKKATVKLKVFDPRKPDGVSLRNLDTGEDAKGTITLSMYDTLPLDAVLSPVGAESELTWKSSSAKLATVENGVVAPTQAKEGTVTITVTTYNGKKATVKVKIVDPLKVIALKLQEGKSATLYYKTSMDLHAVITPDSAQGAELTWKSSKPAVVSVDENGVVTANAKTGSATITVTAKSGKKATIKITCKDTPAGE